MSNERTVILLEKISFDNLENRDPKIREIVGVFESHGKAIDYAQDKLNYAEGYEGYDGKWYPQYETTPVKYFSNP